MRYLLAGLGASGIIAAFVLGAISTAESIQSPAADGGISIENAWARAPVTPETPSAAYMTFVNHDHQPDRILTLSSPSATSVEIHDSRGGQGMVPVPHLEIPPGGKVVLAPGGLHVMLNQLLEPLAVGGTLQLEVTFEKAGRQSIQLPVEPVGAMGPEREGHHH